ncbi:phosphate acetyltransferase [Serratia symbiotica str. 'Cinara cedri']|nr:phosphate acetyltransferase [Serratia symbiotica str. 'Cinara cedri']
MLIPNGTNVGITSVSMGLIRSIEQQDIHISVFKPIIQSHVNNDIINQPNKIVDAHLSTPISTSLHMSYVEDLLSTDQLDVLMEEIITRYDESTKDAEIVLIEGLIPTCQYQFTNSLNYEISKTLNAEIIFVLELGNNSLKQMKQRIKLACNSFGGDKNKNIIGAIINKLNAPDDELYYTHPNLFKTLNYSIKTKITHIDPAKLSASSTLPILGCIPWNIDLIATRAIDIARYLQAKIINEGDIINRRIKSITFCEKKLPYILKQFYPDSLLVASVDQMDVLVSVCIAIINGIKISAILLTGGCNIDETIKKLCSNAFRTGIPIFMVTASTWQTVLNLQHFHLAIPSDDYQRIEKIKNYIASYMDDTWLKSLLTTSKRSYQLSPPAFRYKLTRLARQANKCIVLPEGNEPRTIKAATICAERGIAKCVLLGNPDQIQHIATAQGVKLGKNIKIIDPITVRANYIPRLMELRKDKGITEIMASEQLKDNVMLGTLMLEKGEVDGLVSGAVHTTANTIRPPLQLIKTAPGSSLVSSIFFMLLPDQVLVYGDCAINPDPTAEQLSEIAIQSADSAAAFGIEPRVAMISYSTGNSAKGSDVDKVREASRLAQEKRPDLIIDGPLQYDAAIMVDVAKYKAPNSSVAGQATVFIFPDLNTGNTTYKAVQRSANLISIGPMLQGMRKPVNDLSRGALVNDIIYTVALTAIQSSQINAAADKS